MLKNFAIVIIAVVAVVAVVAFILIENRIPPSFQACVKNNFSNQRSETSQNESFAVNDLIASRLVCTIELIDRHNGFFAALAAFIVAAFTYTLWRSTDKLWRAGNDTLQTTERAFVFIHEFDVELTTAADAKIVKTEHLPERYRSDPDLFITRFAFFPRWKNSGNTPTRKMTIQIDWRGPPGPIPPDYVYRNAPQPFFLAPKAVESSSIVEIPEA